jgi:hypothetical protein
VLGWRLAVHQPPHQVGCLVAANGHDACVELGVVLCKDFWDACGSQGDVKVFGVSMPQCPMMHVAFRIEDCTDNGNPYPVQGQSPRRLLATSVASAGRGAGSLRTCSILACSAQVGARPPLCDRVAIEEQVKAVSRISFFNGGHVLRVTRLPARVCKDWGRNATIRKFLHASAAADDRARRAKGNDGDGGREGSGSWGGHDGITGRGLSSQAVCLSSPSRGTGFDGTVHR